MGYYDNPEQGVKDRFLQVVYLLPVVLLIMGLFYLCENWEVVLEYLKNLVS